MRVEPVELVRRLAEALACGDSAEAAALFEEDAVWHTPVDVARGPAEIEQAIERSRTDTDAFRQDVLGLEVDGDRATIVVWNRGRREGEELDSQQALLVRVGESCIARVEVVVDDPVAVERFWAG